ncbi:MAG: hypothetical protein U5R48_18120 [Gammaproteobacteria bacterium]|nr:hypothetical protein [Gammaproteobacteria bacterium]
MPDATGSRAGSTPPTDRRSCGHRDLRRSETVVLKSFDGSARGACLPPAAVLAPGRAPPEPPDLPRHPAARGRGCLSGIRLHAPPGPCASGTRGPLNAREVVRLAAALLDGLEALHDAGWLHCDLQAGQHLPRRRHTPDYLIGDLGSARGIASPEGHRFAGGTPAYAARKRGPVRRASDLYSLGLVLLEARCGEPVRRPHRRSAATSPPGRGRADTDSGTAAARLRRGPGGTGSPRPAGRLRRRPAPAGGPGTGTRRSRAGVLGHPSRRSAERSRVCPSISGCRTATVREPFTCSVPGDRVLLGLEHAHHLDLVDTARPGIRRSIPLRDGLRRGDDRTLLYRSHRHLLRHVLPTGDCESLLEADPADTLVPCDDRILRFRHGRLHVHPDDPGDDADPGATRPSRTAPAWTAASPSPAGTSATRSCSTMPAGRHRRRGLLPGPVLGPWRAPSTG